MSELVAEVHVRAAEGGEELHVGGGVLLKPRPTGCTSRRRSRRPAKNESRKLKTETLGSAEELKLFHAMASCFCMKTTSTLQFALIRDVPPEDAHRLLRLRCSSGDIP
jgi:hypothetical protein